MAPIIHTQQSVAEVTEKILPAVPLCDQTKPGQNRFSIDNINNHLLCERPNIDLQPSLLVLHSNYVDPAFLLASHHHVTKYH